MNISDNVRYVENHTENWAFYTNKSYTARICRAAKDMVYNVPGKKGVVYNVLEDSYENVTDGGFVLTGIAGEMWPIGAGSLGKYDIAPEDITYEAQNVSTVELDTVFAAIMIPKNIPFTLETDYGERAMLKGNRDGLEHGDGDYILVAVKKVNGRYYPDFSDSGRIINGTIFHQLYKPYCGDQ